MTAISEGSSSVEFNINGLLISEEKIDIDITKLKLMKQPNSNNRYCYCLDSDTKIRMRKIIESYYADIREYFDDDFIDFKLILGFITVNSTDGVNGVCLHRDISDYTFNVYLNDNYEGGALTFVGKTDKINKKYKKICSKIDNNYSMYIKPEKYKSILHRGYNAHQVEKVTSGTRYNLILWCKENEESDAFIDQYKDFII